MGKFDNVEDFIKELPKYLGMCHVHPSCLEYLSDIRVQLSELKSYKDAEEQGLLLKLPCKVGAQVWKIKECSGGGRIPNWHEIYNVNFALELLSDIGKTVFLTEKEAEQALAEMKGV